MKDLLENNLKINRLYIDSLDAIIAFNILCFPIDFWKKEDWIDLLNDERALYYAILDEDKIVGNIFIYNWKGEKDYIKIMNIAIHPEYRKQGLAHKLLNHVVQEMTKLEMFKYCGETRASNLSMQKVFEDCGYRLNVIVENYYTNPNESAYKYVLQLN